MTSVLVVATRNPGKASEIRQMLGEHVQVKTLADYPDIPDVIEDGETFEANASKKALEIALKLNVPVLADDSGLEVDALGGRPGVHSARYGGADLPHSEKVKLLLSELLGVPDAQRTARFVCVMAYAAPNGKVETRHGTIEGRINHAPVGDNGFGYDPIFFVPEKGCTTAQLTPEEKNGISHRGRALREILRLLFV